MEPEINYPLENNDDYIEYDPKDIEQFTRGFNDANLIAEYEPQILNDIDISKSELNNFYIDGLQAGKQQYEREHIQTQLQELSGLRNKSRDLELGLEL